ncbi:MAG TPA: M23 family metallopeptidase [Candidatus Polarisedimenticolia bacterium]|nr:M23 family metallopeptidase [Candidatus Polarisedimenticolia bacterium]
MTALALAAVACFAVAGGQAGTAWAAGGNPAEGVSLFTIPRHIWKEPDRVDVKEKQECFYFQLVVRDLAGRTLEPKTATLRYYAGSAERKTVTLSAEALKALQGDNLTRYSGLEESFDLRHHVCEPAALAIDRVSYTLDLGGAGKKPIHLTLEIPVATATQRVKLIFPLKGNFLVANGTVLEGGHHEWSQMFASDILALGPDDNALVTQGRKNSDFAGWGREVLAPARGKVVYARNDVPDNAAPGVIDMAALEKMPDQPWPLAGNVVVIEHDEDEYSLLAHMQKGSVRVKSGDHVEAGTVLGLLGNSGHSEGPHLHYHLMDGPLLFKSDPLPARFENVEGGYPVQGQMLEAK